MKKSILLLSAIAGVTLSSMLTFAASNACLTCNDTSVQTKNEMITSEIKLGFAHSHKFSSLEKIQPDVTAEYHLPEILSLHHWAVGGSWLFSKEAITAEDDDAVLRLNFSASKVFLVVQNYDGIPIEATLVLNGAPPGGHSGDDALDGHLVIDREGVYELIDLKKITEGLLEIQVDTAGFRANGFTFE